MRQVLQVKEFEAITCIEDDKIKYGKYCISRRDFSDLIIFIKEYTAVEKQVDILQFMKIGYKRNVGESISFNNYVGIIELPSGIQIEILPKIDFGDAGEDRTRTKRVFLKMLRAMRDFEGKIFNDANLNVDNMNLYEIFINIYLQEVQHLVKKGIKSAYIGQENNLNYYKGKLIINKHIHVNLVHKERFYVVYDEFHPDRPENKLIKSTLLKLQKMTKSSENSKEIYRLLSFFEMVEGSINYEKDFYKVVIDRNTKDYALLMQWSKVFLMNRSFTAFSGRQDSKAILFPMEYVYESYVAKQLKKLMVSRGWDVCTQDRTYHLFEEPKNQFALSPDIVLYYGDRCVVLDTKWKVLVDNPSGNYGISQSDMYQVYAYSKKYMTSEIWLLYPLTRPFRAYEDIKFCSDRDRMLLTEVNVFFVDLADEGNIEELGNRICLKR